MTWAFMTRFKSEFPEFEYLSLDSKSETEPG